MTNVQQNIDTFHADRLRREHQKAEGLPLSNTAAGTKVTIAPPVLLPTHSSAQLGVEHSAGDDNSIITEGM